MELLRPTGASLKKTSIKFKLPCQEYLRDPSWLTLESILAYTRGDAVVLKGKLKAISAKNCVVKFGNHSLIQTEYNAGHRIANARIPGFIKYVCMFECIDDFERVLQQNYQTRPYICVDAGGGTRLGGIVMTYYSLGSMNDYRWRRSQLPEFYNVLCQVCFALATAFFRTGFVHSDLHAGNVVLRTSRKKIIDYGDAITLPIGGGGSGGGSNYAMIMDLADPKKDDAERFLTSMNRFLTTACTAEGSDLALEHNPSTIRQWYLNQSQSQWNGSAAKALKTCIEAIPLMYVKSERPTLNFTRNP